MKNMINKLLVMLLLIMSISIGYIGYLKLEDNNVVLDEVKLKETTNNKETFAIMIEQDDGTYKESESDTWPTNMTFNGNLSGCIDEEGNEVDNVLTYDDRNKTASLAIKKRVYCYLYFEFPAATYAIYSDTDNSLTFYNNKDVRKLGSVYNDKNVTKVYTGFKTSIYTSSSLVPWNEYASVIKSVEVKEEISPTSLSYWFYGFLNTSTLELTKLNASRVTEMSYTFYRTGYNTNSFKTDLSNWDTGNVTALNEMFYATGHNSTTWEIGDLSNWDVSNVTNMSSMFNAAAFNARKFNLGNLGSWNVQEVKNFDHTFSSAGVGATEWYIGDLSNWNTGKCESMAAMFQSSGRYAQTFNLGDLSNWNTSAVKSTKEMFMLSGYIATEWYIGTLSNWDVSNVTNMSAMFDQAGAKAKKIALDLSNWDVSNVTNMKRMFAYAWGSASYYFDLSNWQVPNVVNYEGFNVGSSGKIKAPTWVLN